MGKVRGHGEANREFKEREEDVRVSSDGESGR